MDARPNVLNKILPCTKHSMMTHRTSSGGVSDVSLLSGYKLDAGSDEYTDVYGYLPKDFKAGTDVKIIIKTAPTVTNSSGVAKKVRMYCQYGVGRVGAVIAGLVTSDAILITIPDGELANTLHSDTLATISGLQGGDLVGCRLRRDADHTDDDYGSDYWLSRVALIEYTADKIGND